MADISRVSRLLNGVQRQVDLSTNTLVVDNLKVKLGGANSFTFSGTLTADRTISMPDANVNLADIALNTAARHDAVTLNADAPTQDTLNLSGQELQVNLATASTHGAMSASDKSKLDGIEAGATADQLASEVPFTPNGDIAATDVQAAIQEVRDDTDTKLATKLSLSGGTMTGAIDMGSFKITSLANGTASSDAVNKGQLDAVSSLIQNFEWQESVLDAGVLDPTALTPSTGDRYLIDGTGAGAWSGQDNKIAEWDGAAWVFTTPTLGMFVSADDESNLLYYYGGASWSTKAFESTTASGLLDKTGFDIHFATSTAGNFVVYNGSGVASSVTMSGDATLAATGAITLSTTAVTGKLLTGLSIVNGSVTASDSILSAIGKLTGNQEDLVTLSGVAQGSVDLGSFTGTTISDNVSVKTALQELETAHEAHLNDTVGAHAATAISYGGGDLAGTTVEAALDDAGTRILALEGGTAALTEDIPAGETLTAGLKAVRYGKAADAGFVAGRVYFADKDASSVDNFYVIGLATTAGETAGTNVTVYKAGVMPATSHGFTAGQPIYLDASGALTGTAPSTTGHAVVKVGIAKDANNIEVQIQVMGVN